MRDLSKSQFEGRLKKLGFTPAYLGYWNLPEPNQNTAVYAGNGGDKRRSQLAYLIATNRRIHRNAVKQP